MGLFQSKSIVPYLRVPQIPSAAAVNTYTASAACTAGIASCSASATFAKPVYTGTTACSVAPATCSASATFTKPTYTGSTTCTTGRATCSASAAFVKPTYTGTTACTIGAVFTGNAPIATGTGGGPDGSPNGTYSYAGTFQGYSYYTNGIWYLFADIDAGFWTIATVLANIPFSFGNPCFRGPAYESYPSGTYTPQPTYTGSVTVVVSNVATFTKPTYTATGGCTSGAATCSASSTFTKPTYAGTVSCTAGRATCSASATFTKPTYTGSTTCTARAITCSASATYTPSTFTGATACTAPRATCSASMTFLAVYRDTPLRVLATDRSFVRGGPYYEPPLRSASGSDYVPGHT